MTTERWDSPRGANGHDEPGLKLGPILYGSEDDRFQHYQADTSFERSRNWPSGAKVPPPRGAGSPKSGIIEYKLMYKQITSTIRSNNVELNTTKIINFIFDDILVRALYPNLKFNLNLICVLNT